jgi:CRP-like cAMP-binding protein
VATTAALLEDVATQHVRHRLARLLLSLGESRNIKAPHGGLLIDGWTHEELASCVGTVREVASRTLKQFEREGLIRLGRRHLVLLDPIRLKADIPPGPPPSVPQ